MPIKMSFAEGVAFYRKQAKKSQGDIADILGVKRWQIAFLETGRDHKLSEVQLGKVCLNIGTTLKQLRKETSDE